MSLTHAYAGEIVKFDRTPDGDLLVFGKATGPDLDLDEQVCDPTWLKSAMPEWARWSNVREMHGPVAAGVGVETTQDGDDWHVKSLITDRDAAHKVETGTYKGYSIGIKNARVVKDATAPGGRIVGGTIAEISLVDRPCNPTATVAIAKAAKPGGLLEPVEAEEGPADINKAAILDTETTGTVEKSAAAFDRDLALAIAEKAAAGDRDAALALLPVDTEKAVAADGLQDEVPDIAGGKQVIALLGRLICAEAEELAAGYLDEACDIRILLQAVSAVTCWLQNEMEAEDDPGTPFDLDDDEASPMVYIGLDVEADVFKYVNAADRRRYAKTGVAMPNGDFPIPDTDHLRSAVGRLGNYKGDKAAAKKHIIARAKALGATNLLPDDWTGASDTVKSAAGVAAAVGAMTGTAPSPTPDSGSDDTSVNVATAGDGAQALLDDADADRAKASKKARKKAKKVTMNTTGQPNPEAVTTAATAAKAATADDQQSATIDQTSVTDIVKAAVREATRAQEERIEALGAELAKVLATPVPGGPVLIPPTAVPTEQAEHISKGARLRAIARQTGDPTIARAYIALAEKVENQTS